MNKLTIFYSGKPDFIVYYDLLENGLNAQILNIKKSAASDKKELEEFETLHIAADGTLQAATEFKLFQSPLKVAIYNYTIKTLYQIGYEESIFEVSPDFTASIKELLLTSHPADLSYEVKEFSNVENLAYLYREALLSDTSPLYLAELINKLKWANRENKQDPIISFIDQVLTECESYTDEKILRANVISLFSKNVDLFEDVE
jgi:hypothetical protein